MIYCGPLTDTAEPDLVVGQGASRRANDTRLSAAWSALEDPSIAVVTTDVFDTLVFRTVRRPVDAFALIGARLAEQGLLAARLPSDSFQGLRQTAERVARERMHAAAGTWEVTIREIYAAFPAWARAGDERLHELIETEVAVEREVCVPDLEITALLIAAQEAGKRVAIVSDNYLGAANLRAVLAQPPLGELSWDAIFCSCDHRTGKGGDLWDIVLDELGVRPEQILHLGDNKRDDVQKPAKLGVRAVFYEQRPEESEDTLDAERRLVAAADARPLPRGVPGGSDFGLTALRGKVLGARWDVPEGMYHYWEYGASVLGPAFTGFADWIAREARLLGFGSVHCLMREGTFLSALVEAADDARRAPGDEPLAVDELWLNRHTCLVAAMGEIDHDALRHLYAGRTSLTMRQALALLGLAPSDVPALAGHGATRLDDVTIRDALIREIEGSDELKAKAWAHARKQRERVVALLEAAADDNGRVLMVDLGWGASIQDLANRCLRAAGSDVYTVGLYLLTHSGATERMVEGAEVYGFLGDSGGPHDLAGLVMRSPEILEQVCTADVGSQLGLTADLEPITEDLDPRLEGQRREIGWVRRGVHAFQDLWHEYDAILPGRLGDLADARPQLLAQVARALIAPTAREAALFGDWQHDEGRGSSRLDEIAGAGRLELASHATPRQLRESPMSTVYWPWGLMGRAAEHHGALLSAVAAGLLPWEATETELEIGLAELRGVRGHWGPPTEESEDDEEAGGPPRAATQPLRNISGNSLLSLRITAPDIQAIELMPGFKPHVLRLDFLKVSLWEQGRDQPRELLLGGGETSAAPWTHGYVELAHNVFAAPAPGCWFSVDLEPLREAVVYAVDVECGFSALPIPAPLDGRLQTQVDAEILDRARRTLAGMESSLSWRITKPLRSLKGLAGRG
ncbi:MAG: superfamily hydrolase-like protein [Conexibacter sp.]|nr:superfamily hydrolase-like protein [Conexibacter sp.]